MKRFMSYITLKLENDRKKKKKKKERKKEKKSNYTGKSGRIPGSRSSTQLWQSECNAAPDEGRDPVILMITLESQQRGSLLLHPQMNKVPPLHYKGCTLQAQKIQSEQS